MEQSLPAARAAKPIQRNGGTIPLTNQVNSHTEGKQTPAENQRDTHQTEHTDGFYTYIL